MENARASGSVTNGKRPGQRKNSDITPTNFSNKNHGRQIEGPLEGSGGPWESSSGFLSLGKGVGAEGGGWDCMVDPGGSLGGSLRCLEVPWGSLGAPWGSLGAPRNFLGDPWENP